MVFEKITNVMPIRKFVNMPSTKRIIILCLWCYCTFSRNTYVYLQLPIYKNTHILYFHVTHIWQNQPGFIYSMSITLYTLLFFYYFSSPHFVSYILSNHYIFFENLTLWATETQENGYLTIFKAVNLELSGSF